MFNILNIVKVPVSGFELMYHILQFVIYLRELMIQKNVV